MSDISDAEMEAFDRNMMSGPKNSCGCEGDEVGLERIGEEGRGSWVCPRCLEVVYGVDRSKEEIRRLLSEGMLRRMIEMLHIDPKNIVSILSTLLAEAQQKETAI